MRELGQGGFGKVLLGKHKEEKKEVAIKFMDVSELCRWHDPLISLNLFLSFSTIGKHDSEYL